MIRRVLTSAHNKTRRVSVSTTAFGDVEDEGDWRYSSEWWNPHSESHIVVRSASNEGNGVVSVIAHPSSRPRRDKWGKVEKWVSERYREVEGRKGEMKVLGYEWRCLHFNQETRQSTVKVMLASHKKDSTIFLMQQPHCLALPYVKSMVSAGLTAIASCNYDLTGAVNGKKPMRILCIGHGGGSLPLFLASKIQGAVVDIVEIDPIVISVSVQAMGFPAFSVMNSSGHRLLSKPSSIDEVFWKGIHERLHLYKSDAEDFVVNTQNIYDMVFIDAYDGEDIFPWKLWDPNSAFLQALSKQLHPEHGTVVVNLHSDEDAFNPNPSYFYEQLLPMSHHVGKVCRAYKDSLISDRPFSGAAEKQSIGIGFRVSAPWLCNTSLAVCRGFSMKNQDYNQDSILNALISKSYDVENVLNLPFSCLEYFRRGFTLIH